MVFVGFHMILIIIVLSVLQYASAQTVAGTGALRVMGGFLVSPLRGRISVCLIINYSQNTNTRSSKRLHV